MSMQMNPFECKSNYSATSNNKFVQHWPLTGGLLHLVQRGGDWAGPQLPSPLAVPNVTADPSTTSVPITVLLYNGPLLCGFNVSNVSSVRTGQVYASELFTQLDNGCIDDVFFSA